MRIIIVLIMYVSFLFSASQEEIDLQIKKYSNNIGFITGSKRDSLKEKFPICDQFLDIHWFDNTKGKEQRGWVSYEAYVKKYDRKSKQKKLLTQPNTIDALVWLDNYGDIKFSGIYFIKKAFPKTWKSVLQKMERKVHRGSMVYTYKDKKYDASREGDSLANNYLNICSISSDDIAILNEKQRTKNILSEYNINIYTKGMNNIKTFFLNQIPESIPLDVNKDGVIDFILNVPIIIYSAGNEFYKTQYSSDYSTGKKVSIYSFPVTDEKCSWEFGGSDEYIYMQDKRLFVNNRNQVCNLTEMTTKKGQH